ncbi:NAD(P)H-dependent oxidoreductase [Mucilaginibacter sp. CSA2-8R]|uniref:FMN-dependent NADH-azoreductase n=1 Tax=Mucilaginibacter sp. CSA2-8R TaxID=3141542 RepID=UPI00315D9C18
MKRILHLTSSILGSESKSIKLGRAVVDKVIEKYPGSSIEEVNLVELEVPHLTPATFQSFLVPGDQLTDDDRQSIRYSEQFIAQLQAADVLVVGAPLYNFTIHTALKSWIDHITRPGVTFKYSEQGPVGLITGKKVYIAFSSGGVYSHGPGAANDFVIPYLVTFFRLLGLTDVTVFRAEGLKVPGIMEHAMDKAIQSIVID